MEASLPLWAPAHLHRPIAWREGKPVAWEDLVKGYEYEKGRFIILTKDDLKTAALSKGKSIQILDFVESDAIDVMNDGLVDIEGADLDIARSQNAGECHSGLPVYSSSVRARCVYALHPPTALLI